MTSSPASDRPVATDVPRLGATLREARERLGWTLADSGAQLRLSPGVLAALEAGMVRTLPGHAYTAGFIRNYAALLGLDAAAAVEAYQAELGRQPAPPALNFPEPLAPRRMPRGALAALLVVLAVGGYVGVLHRASEHGDQVRVQQVPPRLQPLALPPVPAPPAKLAAAAEAPSGPATVYTLPAVSPNSAAASVPAPGSLAPVVPPATLAAGPPLPGQIVLRATADAWVQVKDGQGRVVLSKLMHAGDSWAVPQAGAGAAPLTLTTGNAGGTMLSLGGRTLQSLGADGAVRHDIKLDPSALQQAAAPG